MALDQLPEVIVPGQMPWDQVFDQWPGYFNDPGYWNPDTFNAPVEPQEPEPAPAPAPAPPAAAPPAAPPPAAPPIDLLPEVVIEHEPAPAPPRESLPVLPTVPVFDPAAFASFFGGEPAPQLPPARTPRRRRTVPTRRTRPVRPTRTVPRQLPPSIPRQLPVTFPRPRPGDPVPRFLSYVIRGASRVLGGIGMLLTPMTAGPREFDEYYGQPLFFPRDERDDSDRRDNRDAGPAGVGPVTLGPTSLDTLPELKLTGARRPDTPYSFADLALPFAPSFPGLDVGGITFPSAGPQPNSETAPEPRLSPAPSPEFLNVPTPKPAPEPFLDLSPSLDPFPEALPRPQAPPRDVITLTPPPLGSPEAPIFGAIDPVPPLGPIPKEDLDRCRCPKPKEKKKKSKDRDECLAGGYVENSKSTRKRPLRVVDCATGKTIRKYKPKPKKKPAKKPKLRSV